MPLDILNNIASLLYESEDEFIIRTKENHTINAVSKGVLSASCPDKISFITLGSSDNKLFVNPKLIIRKNDVVYEGQLDTSGYRCIALSRGGSMIGMFYNKQIFHACFEHISYKYFLEIQKIDLKKNKEDKGIIIQGEKYALCPNTNALTSIDFNKQGTHLIVHGKNMLTQESEHTIFSLKNSDLDKPQAIIHDTNKLQTYFREKLVCKKYIEGTK
jgi:hypothetical protein